MGIVNASSLLLCCLAGLALAGQAWGGDPVLRELERSQQMRQQQQDALQLRMQQYHRSVQTPPADTSQQQAIQQLEIEQRQRQQETHYRQNIEAQPTAPADDEGTRRAKGQIEQQRAEQQGQQQLRRFDWELEQAGKRAEETSETPDVERFLMLKRADKRKEERSRNSLMNEGGDP